MAENSANVVITPDMLNESGSYASIIELNNLMHDVSISVTVTRRVDQEEPVRLIPSWVPYWRCGGPTVKPGKPPCRYPWKICPVFKHAKIRYQEGKIISRRYADRLPHANVG